MLTTKITTLFGIKHPIVQCGVGSATGPNLVAAVANAGALGFLPAHRFGDDEGLAKAIGEIKAQTDRPFGISLGFWVGEPDVNPDALFDVIASTGVSIVELSSRTSYLYTDRLKVLDARVIHTCKSVKDARNSEKAGADAVILEGIEGLGDRTDLDVGSSVLTPAAADGLRIPVIASGGYADGRGLAAALCLGAAGIAMKTRFVLTAESDAHPGVKGYLMQALEGDTVLVKEAATRGLRVLKTPVSERLYLKNRRGEKVIGLADESDPVVTGDLSSGLLQLGQSVGLIRDISTAKEVIERTAQEAAEVLGRVGLLFP